MKLAYLIVIIGTITVVLSSIGSFLFMYEQMTWKKSVNQEFEQLLEKYDRNGNGLLDMDERATLGVETGGIYKEFKASGLYYQLMQVVLYLVVVLLLLLGLYTWQNRAEIKTKWREMQSTS